ncbi:MAG: hypothetical protein HKO76_01625, partial [Acidimicrobiia bacterium]|nr:hypothetical protein [Acidimicrobiia bacterium]
MITARLRTSEGRRRRVERFCTIGTVARRQVRRVVGNIEMAFTAAISNNSQNIPLAPSAGHIRRGVVTAPPTGPHTDGIGRPVAAEGIQYAE